jgi:hypothetical protein
MASSWATIDGLLVWLGMGHYERISNENAVIVIDRPRRPEGRA